MMLKKSDTGRSSSKQVVQAFREWTESIKSGPPYLERPVTGITDKKVLNVKQFAPTNRRLTIRKLAEKI